MKLTRLRNMIGVEVQRVLIQPWFWLAVLAIALIKFIDTFCSPERYSLIFVKNLKELSVLNLYALQSNETFLAYASFCICAFPVAGNFVQDYRNNRLSTLLPRESYLEYALTQTVITVCMSALCMILGGCICVLAACIFLHLPFATERIMGMYSQGRSALLATGHPYLYYLFWELRYGAQAAFFSLLTLLASIWIKDRQFVVIFPMIVRYFFFMLLLPSYEMLVAFPAVELICPKNIFDSLFYIGYFRGNDILTSMYAIFIVCLLGGVITCLLNMVLKRWRN